MEASERHAGDDRPHRRAPRPRPRRRPTRSARSPATCASTSWSTRPTGWWAASCPTTSSKGASDGIRDEAGRVCAASCASGRRSRSRSRSWRRPRRWRSTASRVAGLIGRAVPLAFIFALGRRAARLLRLRPAVPRSSATPARSTRSRASRSARAPASSPAGRCSAPTCASPSPRRAEVGLFFTPFLAATGIWNSADWIWIALVAARADLGDRLRRHPRRHPLAAGDRGHLGHADRDPVVVIFAKLDRPAPRPTARPHSATPSAARAARRWTRRDRAPCSASCRSRGFEGAAALGEETDEPRRNIPRAIFLAPLIAAASSTSS